MLLQDSPFCCEEYKEFCILAATCMQQMVLRMTQEKPKRIAIKPGRRAIRKTAEERAFAMWVMNEFYSVILP